MNKSAILAIDAATEACSVALSFQGQSYHRFERCPQQHSQRILPMVDEVLKQAGIKLTCLDVLAFSQGPGSFTGVRIGVGVAQGLAFGADLPLVGLSTLQIMAQGAIRLNGAKQVVAAIDARMGEIYCNEYRVENGLALAVGEERVVKPQLAAFDFNDHVYAVGTGWQTYPDELNGKFSAVTMAEVLYPDAQDMLVLAQQALDQGLQLSAAEAQPVYVRDTVTWKKLPGRE